MINPTVGRKVWYRPGPQDKNDPFSGTSMATMVNGDPLDATVVAVWGDRMVNLVVFDATGNMFKRPSVPLLQDDDEPPVGQAYAEWMPYQKTASLEPKAVDANGQAT